MPARPLPADAAQVQDAKEAVQSVRNSSATPISKAAANASMASREGFAVPVSIRLMYVRAKPNDLRMPLEIALMLAAVV